MTDNPIPIKFCSDGVEPIQNVIKAYHDGRDRPMSAKQVRDNGGPTNSQQLSRIGQFLQDIGVLEQPSGTTDRQLTLIGRELAQALKGKNDLYISECWQRAMVSDANMRELLIQIRSREPFSYTKLINLLMKIIVKNLRLQGRRMNSKSIDQAAHSLYTLMTKAYVLIPGKQGNLLVSKAVLYPPDKTEKVGVARPMPRITSEIETTLTTEGWTAKMRLRCCYAAVTL